MKIKDKKLTAGLVLTWKCNLKCIHCYPYLPKNKEPALKEIKSKIDQFKKEGYLFLNITGGEPLMKEEFFDIIKYANNNNFALLLSTNGTLITKEFIKKIKRFNIFQIQVSLFGATQKMHEDITRVKGSFEKTIRAIRLLKKEGLRTVIKITKMPKNLKEISKIKVLAEELGTDYIESLLR
ncbi:MAG TPA: radical SAM protein [Candidatus Omnitrophica bacterium]|nr:radical SAM protein [Candidatus Omnitrophota bacterium]